MFMSRTSGVLSVCVLLICMTCQLEQQRGSNVTSTQEDNPCMPGYFGQGCARKCPGPCSKTCDSHGQCTVCSRTGVQLPNCTVECATGLYGLHCKNRCIECRNSVCNPQSGECRECRFPGLRLPFCTTPCLPGTFGMDCKNRCPLPCSRKCDLTTGDCLECEHGHGPRCLVNCASNENIEVCERYCLGRCLTWCNSSTGECSVCSPGYKAPYCRDPCDEGQFGHNCAEKCSSRCQDGRCDATTGVCYTCNNGYVGERCNGQCIPGFYGAGCLSSCPPTCADGLCNFTTGDCTRCNPGYTGPACDQLCAEGQFGEGCKLDCPVTCGGKCDPVSGECWRCLPGYVGVFCNESCKQGTHGSGCASLCPAGCLQRMCDHVTGACKACEENLRGKLCDQSAVTSTTPIHLLILISLLMTSVALTLLIVIICFRRKLRNSHTETTDKQEDNQSKEEGADILSISDKQQTLTTTQSVNLSATSERRARDSLSSQGKDVQRCTPSALPAYIFTSHAQQFHNSPSSDNLVAGLRHGLRSTKLLARKEFDSQSRQDADKQLAVMLKQRPQGIAAQTSYSSAIEQKRFAKATGQMNWYTGKRLLKKESVMDLSKLDTFPHKREQWGFPSEGRTSSMRGESLTRTPGNNEFRSDGKSARETKITLVEHAECLSGKTTLSTAWTVNLPPYAPLISNRQTPEMAVAESRDSFFSGRIISSADSLFGLTSADLSHGMSNMSQRNSKLLEREQKSQAKNNPSCYQIAMNTIRLSNSHIFSDTRAAIPRKGTLLRRPPSAHSLPDTIYSTHLTCVTRPEHISSDDRNKVHSDDLLALTNVDLNTRRRNLLTKHEINIHDQLGSHVRKPRSLSEAAKISHASERSVVSDSAEFARRTPHGDRTRGNDTQAGHDSPFYSSLTKAGKRGQREPSSVPGDETIPHSETNSWLNCEDADDTATCCDISSQTKADDVRHISSEMMHIDLPQKAMPLTRNFVGSSSYHRVPDLHPDITPPKQLVKTDMSLDEDVQHESSDALLLFQNQSEKLTTMQCTDQEMAADKAAQAQDDLFVHSIPAKSGVGSKRTTRVPGDNASPKLIRCSTTRQVSPMYSHNTSQANTRLQPLPTPPPEGIKLLRPIRKQSMSSSSSESQLPDQDTAHEKHHS